MKKILLLLVTTLIANPFSVQALALSQQDLEDVQKDIQQGTDNAKKQINEGAQENLGTLTTPQQQKDAFKRLFNAFDVVIDETEEEVKGSKNLTNEQKQQILKALGMIEQNLATCEASIDASKTQEELNAAYQKCVENVQATISTFMNEVYDVILEAIAEYLRVTELYLKNTLASIKIMDQCEAVDDEDIAELNELMERAYTGEDALHGQLKDKYENEMLKSDYNRQLVVQAGALMTELSALLARLQGEFEDQYYIYQENCGGGALPNDTTQEEIEGIINEVTKEIKGQLPQ